MLFFCMLDIVLVFIDMTFIPALEIGALKMFILRGNQSTNWLSKVIKVTMVDVTNFRAHSFNK